MKDESSADQRRTSLCSQLTTQTKIAKSLLMRCAWGSRFIRALAPWCRENRLGWGLVVRVIVLGLALALAKVSLGKTTEGLCSGLLGLRIGKVCPWTVAASS